MKRVSAVLTGHELNVNTVVELAPVVAPLYELLGKLLVGTKRANPVANNRTLREESRTTEHAVRWIAGKRTPQSAVTLSPSKKGWNVLMFPDASGLC